VHAKQDDQNGGHHQWHHHHHWAKHIFCCCHCLQYNCYHSVTLKAWMHLANNILLSLLQVQQVHEKQENAQVKGIISGIVIRQSISSTAAIVSSMITTTV
jgi:hypothetical protein